MDRKRQRIINFIVIIITLAVCAIIIAISFNIKSKVEQDVSNSVTNPDDNNSNSGQNPDQPSDPTPGTDGIVEAKFINLQPTLDKWLDTLSGDEKTGVMIYDLNNSRTAASYHEHEIFNVASIYKLLFAYDGYRQIAMGINTGNEVITTTSDKGELTLSACLDLIIRESYNGCADVLAADKTRVSRVNGLIKNFEMTNTSNIGLQSTAADLTKLLRVYWRHSELSNQLWQRLSDSMLNQPPTATADHPLYDWRQGLPAGFSDNVKVYNKVGWERNAETERWNIYADAAIVDFTAFQHYYTVVVLTQNLSNHTKITQLGRMIEETVNLQSAGVIK